MFLRIVKAAGGKGIEHEYVRLVENYRAGGKVKQRLVASLGRKELLVAHLDALNRLLRGEEPARGSGAGQAAQAIQAWDWGVSLVAGVLWRELGLEQILDRRAKGRRGDTVTLADRVLALVANRLQAPGSEHGFRNLNDVIDMRPIYQQTDERAQAHIFVAALAFLLHRALEKKLKAAGIDLSATEALTALKTIRVVDIDQGNGKTKRCVTRGSERAGRILAGLGISNRNPPTPPIPFETLM